MISLPIPGHANTVSVTVENAISDPNSSPTTVTMGIRIFFSICTKTILFFRQTFLIEQK